MREDVYVTLDVATHTWNVMCGVNCVFYSANVDDIDPWLKENSDKYKEVKG